MTSRDYGFYGGVSAASVAVEAKEESYLFSGHAAGLSRVWNYGFDGKDLVGLVLGLKATRYQNRFEGEENGREVMDHGALGVGFTVYQHPVVRWHCGASAEMIEIRRSGENAARQRYRPAPGFHFGFG